MGGVRLTNHAHSLTFSLSYFSLTHPLTLARAHALTLSLSFSLTLTVLLSHCLTLSLSHVLKVSLPLSHSLTLSRAHSLTVTFSRRNDIEGIERDDKLTLPQVSILNPRLQLLNPKS